jgi:hypothetical protein
MDLWPCPPTKIIWRILLLDLRIQKLALSSIVVLSTSFVALNSSICFATVPDAPSNFDISNVKPVYPIDDSIFSKENINKFCPSSLTPTTDQTNVATQLGTSISQKWADTYLKDALMQQSTFRHINNKVEEVSKKSITITSASPSSIEQKINFNVKAIEGIAVAAYEGYFHSEAIYKASANSISWNFSKPVSRSTTLAICNTTSVSEFNPSSKFNLTYSF